MNKKPHYTSKRERTLLTVREAAAYIHRHRATLDKWRGENIVLPYHRDGRVVLYDIADLDAYLDSTRVEPVAYRGPSAAQSTEAAA